MEIVGMSQIQPSDFIAGEMGKALGEHLIKTESYQL